MANMTSICKNNQDLGEMISSYREGNNEIFPEIYAACRKIAEKIFYNTASAEQRGRLCLDDLFQDAIVKVWRNLDRFDAEKGSFSTWFGTVFRNTFMDAERAGRIRMSSDISTIDETQICTSSISGFYKAEVRDDYNPCVRRQNSFSQRLVEDEFINRETLDEIIGCMESSLSAQQQEAIRMFYFEGMSVEEISKAQGCGVNSVKSRLHQGRNKLRPKLEEMGLVA